MTYSAQAIATDKAIRAARARNELSESASRRLNPMQQRPALTER